MTQAEPKTAKKKPAKKRIEVKTHVVFNFFNADKEEEETHILSANTKTEIHDQLNEDFPGAEIISVIRGRVP